MYGNANQKNVANVYRKKLEAEEEKKRKKEETEKKKREAAKKANATVAKNSWRDGKTAGVEKKVKSKTTQPKPIQQPKLIEPLTRAAQENKLVAPYKNQYYSARASKNLLGMEIANKQANQQRLLNNMPLYNSAKGDVQFAVNAMKKSPVDIINQNLKRNMQINNYKAPLKKSFGNGNLKTGDNIRNTNNPNTALNQGTKQLIDTSPYARGYKGFQQGINPIYNMEKQFMQRYGDNSVNKLNNSTAYKVGNFLGEATKFGVGYGVLGGGIEAGVKALPAMANVGKLGTAVTKSLATDLAVDSVLQPLQVIGKEGKRGGEAAKEIAGNTAIDMALGAGLEGAGALIGRALKSGKNIKTKPTEKGEFIQYDDGMMNVSGHTYKNGDTPIIDQMYYSDELASDVTDVNNIPDQAKNKGNATKATEEYINYLAKNGYTEFKGSILNDDSYKVFQRLAEDGKITQMTEYKFEGDDVFYKINTAVKGENPAYNKPEPHASGETSYIDASTVPNEKLESYQGYLGSTDKEFKAFIENSMSGKISPKAYKNLSPVSQNEVKRIAELTGADTSGYTHGIKSSTINGHIAQRHGINGAADKSMADINDLARVEHVMNNADSIELLKMENGEPVKSGEIFNNDGSRADMIKYTKRINGHHYVAIAIPDDKNKALQVVSAYIKKANTNVPTKKADQLMNMAKSPAPPTFETPAGIAPKGTTAIDSISQQAENNVKIFENDKSIPEAGDLVKAKDRKNYGRIEGVNADGTYAVHFISPEGYEKTVSFGEDQIELVKKDSKAAKSEEYKKMVKGLQEEIALKKQSGESGIRRSQSQQYQKKAVNSLTKRMSEILGASKYADKTGIKAAINTMLEKAKTAQIGEAEKNALFDTLYDESIVISDEFYKKYKPVKTYLRNTLLKVNDEEIKNIADWKNFRKSNFGKLRLSQKDGKSIDIIYEELSDEYPELFGPFNTTTEQLEKMAEVASEIKITERNLEAVYGSEAEQFKEYARYEFQKEFDNVELNAEKIKRYDADKKSRIDAKELTLEEVQKYNEVAVKLKREYESVQKKFLLTEGDKEIVEKLLKGKIKPDDVKGITAKDILKVYEAKKPYHDLMEPIIAYRKFHKQELNKYADELVKDIDSFKDKKNGQWYARETAERNIQDISKNNKAAGERIINEIFTPVHKNEAESIKLKNKYRDKIRGLNIDDKKKYSIADLSIINIPKDKPVSESTLIQLFGEKQITLEDLKHVGADSKKISNSVDEMRKIYNELITKANKVLVKNGYDPIEYRKDYFPHFEDNQPDGVLGKIAKTLGMEIQVDELPTDIAGLTHTFKPGKRWFANALSRTGENTVYDAIQGFDMYIEGASDVIYHTDDIQKLRALENRVRYKFSDKGTKEAVDEILESDLNEQLKQDELDKVYTQSKSKMSNFAQWLRSYTDTLAGKKALSDRNMEQFVGRTSYNTLKALENRGAANMVAINPASWLTNLIPLTQGTEVSSKASAKAFTDTLGAIFKDDGFTKKSQFLISRKGSDALYKTKVQKAADTLSRPMGLIDEFTTEVLTRAKYYDCIQKGADEAEAMARANKFTASVVGDRSKGALPTVFHQKNPLAKIFTMFQVEVNNQLSYLFKDLPRNMQGEAKTKYALALTKYAVGAYIFNDAYEKVVGRRPSLDPIGILNESIGDTTGYQLPNTIDAATGKGNIKTEKKGVTAASAKLGINVLESLPFIGSALGGGRVPISSAFPDVQNLGNNVVGIASGEKNRKKAASEIGKELLKPAFYLIPPLGGGQLKKITETAKTLKNEGDYLINHRGENELRFAADRNAKNIVKGGLFGKYSMPGGKAYVESDFDKLSAKETKMYEALKNAGYTPQEAEKYIRSLSGKKPKEKQEALMRSDLNANQRNAVGKLLNDKEVDYTDESTYKFSYLSEAVREKYEDKLDNKGISEKEFVEAYEAQKGYKSDVLKAMSLLKTSTKGEILAKGMGISDLNIAKAKGNLNTNISTGEFQKTMNATNDYTTDLGKALVAIKKSKSYGEGVSMGLGISKSTIEKAKLLNKVDISGKQYESFKNSADADKNGSVSKEEAKKMLDKNKSLTALQKAYMLKAMANVKDNKNPYM